MPCHKKVQKSKPFDWIQVVSWYSQQAIFQIFLLISDFCARHSTSKILANAYERKSSESVWRFMIEPALEVFTALLLVEYPLTWQTMVIVNKLIMYSRYCFPWDWFFDQCITFIPSLWILQQTSCFSRRRLPGKATEWLFVPAGDFRCTPGCWLGQNVMIPRIFFV